MQSNAFDRFTINPANILFSNMAFFHCFMSLKRTWFELKVFLYADRKADKKH